MSAAQVHSLEKLLDFQAALATYTHQAKEALSSNDMEVRRAQDWLEGKLEAWNGEVRRCEDEVFKAKQELARRRLMRIGDRHADTTEQEIMLARAVERLRHAEGKRAACRRWLRDLPEAIDEYRGRATNYQTILESDVPRMAAFLDRKMDLLEAYAQVGPADGPRPGDKP